MIPSKSTRPRIAIAGRYYNTQGGVSNVLAQLATRAAASDKYDVTVISSEFLDLDGSEGFTTVTVPMLARPSWAQVPSFARKASAVIDHGHFDLVHAHDPQLLRADLFTAHSCSAAYLGAKRHEASAAAALGSRVHPKHVVPLRSERRAYESAAQVVAVSGSVAEEINAHYRRDVPASHIYNGVDVQKFAGIDPREAQEWLREVTARHRGDTFNLAFVGYEFGRKRLATVIDALPALDRRVEVIVAGKGPIEEYRRYAHDRGVSDRVHFLGHTARIDLLLAACDAFVFPTKYEAASLAILEALASGTPVVTTDVAMAHEVLTDGETALLLPNTDDPAHLVGAVSALLASDELGHRIGASAAELATQYNWDAVWSRYEAVYDEMLSAKRAN